MTGTQTSIKVLHRTNSKSYNLLINHSIECLNFNQMLITLSGLLIGFAVVFGSAAPLFADYTLILKNGRTVTVAAYKEEGDMIIFSSYGGGDRHSQERRSVDYSSRRRSSYQTGFFPNGCGTGRAS